LVIHLVLLEVHDAWMSAERRCFSEAATAKLGSRWQAQRDNRGAHASRFIAAEERALNPRHSAGSDPSSAVMNARKGRSAVEAPLASVSTQNLFTSLGYLT
jgi:hypothetical protein